MNKKHIAILTAILAMPACAMAQASADSAMVKAKATPEKVHVAYQTVDSDEILGGVSVLDMKDMLEKNYLNGVQTGWESYVSGWNGNSLWGMDGGTDTNGALVLIDGVPRDYNNISPSEIDQITFLKGAQAVVLYGSRAAKGAILITTKRGTEGPLTISVRANTGWNVAKEYPEYLGSAEYMTLYNEARANDGLTPSFNDQTIYNSASGLSPYRYPNVNFYSKDYIRKAYNFTDATAEITGGNQLAHFYTNVNYMRNDDMINFGEGKKNYTDRFSVRGNIDLNLGSWVHAYVDASATFYNSRSGHGDFWAEAASMRPNRINPLIPISMVNADALDALTLINSSAYTKDGYFLSGTAIDKTNIFADYIATGYSKYTSRQFQFNTGIDVNLDQVVKGLSFNTLFAVDYATSYNTSYTDQYSVFVPTWSNLNGADEIVAVTQEGIDRHSGVQNISNSSDRQTMHFSAQFNYNRTFADVHNLRAIALASGWQRTYSGEYHRTSNANLGFQVDYNFDKRYYVDLSLAGVHSARFAPGHRQAWSPSATLGWRISQEDFLKDSEAVNELMLSVSASNLHTDLDIDGWFDYTANYRTEGWFSWTAYGGYEAASPTRGENTDFTFVKRKEISANLKGRLFNDLIDFDFSFFKNKIEGLPINTSTKFPTYFTTYYPNATYLPWLNYNDNERIGFDYNVRFNKTVGNVDLTLGLVGTYYDTKATKRDELFADAYQNRQGKILDGVWGYECEGFFNSYDEISEWADQSALGGQNLQPGDLKYKDQNGDGQINSQDRVQLAKGGWYGAPYTFGVNLTAQYKGFTLFIAGTGYYGGHAMKNNSYWWVKGEDKYSAVVRDRWTPETADTALYPRLTTTDGSNNFVDSSFWLYSTDRFNLSKVQLTYTFDGKIFDGKIVKGISIYASGSNLLTVSKERKTLETSIGSAPQTRFYNIGAKVTF